MPNPELIRALEAAVNAAPGDVAIRAHLANLLLADGRYADAVLHYRKALDLAPSDGDMKLALAEAYAGDGKADVALVVLEDLFRAGSIVSPKSWLLAARLYLSSGQQQEAAKAYRKAVTADSELADPELDVALGSVLAGSKDTAPKKKIAWKVRDQEPEPGREDPLTVEGDDLHRAGDLVEMERPKIDFDDVGGMEKLKEEIRMKIIYPLQHPELFQAYGKTAGGGILMYGPPGCGKTFLARATAGEVAAEFLSVGLHDVLDMYIGQSERNLHEIFVLARKKAPCVLFFDEVDALGASRADLRHNALRQVINQFLAELDGVDTSNEGILIMAATNTPWFVDQALRRPGRFDRVLFVPPPDPPAREAILRLMLQGKPVVGIDYARLAKAAEAFSGADLKGALDQAVEKKLTEAMRSKNGDLLPLTTSDLLSAIQKQRPTTIEWFETARSYAIYANEGGLYDDILAYLKMPKGPRL